MWQPLSSTRSSLSNLSAPTLAVMSEISALLWPSAPSWLLWLMGLRWPCAEPGQARLWWATWPPSLACSKLFRALWPASYLELWPTGASIPVMLPRSTALSSMLSALLWLCWWSWWLWVGGPRLCAACPLTASWWCAPSWRFCSTWVHQWCGPCSALTQNMGLHGGRHHALRGSVHGTAKSWWRCSPLSTLFCMWPTWSTPKGYDLSPLICPLVHECSTG